MGGNFKNCSSQVHHLEFLRRLENASVLNAAASRHWPLHIETQTRDSELARTEELKRIIYN